MTDVVSRTDAAKKEQVQSRRKSDPLVKATVLCTCDGEGRARGRPTEAMRAGDEAGV